MRVPGSKVTTSSGGHSGARNYDASTRQCCYHKDGQEAETQEVDYYHKRHEDGEETNVQNWESMRHQQSNGLLRTRK